MNIEKVKKYIPKLKVPCMFTGTVMCLISTLVAWSYLSHYTTDVNENTELFWWLLLSLSPAFVMAFVESQFEDVDIESFIYFFGTLVFGFAMMVVLVSTGDLYIENIEKQIEYDSATVYIDADLTYKTYKFSYGSKTGKKIYSLRNVKYNSRKLTLNEKCNVIFYDKDNNQTNAGFVDSTFIPSDTESAVVSCGKNGVTTIYNYEFEKVR